MGWDVPDSNCEEVSVTRFLASPLQIPTNFPYKLNHLPTPSLPTHLISSHLITSHHPLETQIKSPKQQKPTSQSCRQIKMEMAAMESSRLEPLLFSDLGGFVVHNVWTWVALLSAALGFFGLRLFPVPSTPSSPTTTTAASSTTNPFASNTRSDDDHSTLPDHPTSSDSTTTTTISASTTTTEIAIDGCCTIRRRKITAAYCRDEEEDDDVAEEQEEEEIGVDDDVDFGGIGGGDDDVVVRWQEASRGAELEYEVVMMRMREMGWYKFQDLSMLDGSVVRLWEGGATASSCIALTVAAVADGWLIR